MRIKDRSTVYIYSISICMGSFVLGYQLTSFPNIHHLIAANNDFHTEDELITASTILTSTLALAAIFGAGFYKFFISNFAFLKTFRYFDYLTIVAAVLGMLSLSFKVQLLSRLMFGFVVGVNTIVIPTYLTSCLPGSMGGPAGTLNQLFITIGILHGFVMGLTIADETESELGWRLIIGFPIIPTLIRLYTTEEVFPFETVEYMMETNDDHNLQIYLDTFFEDITLAEFKELKTLPYEEVESEQVPYFDHKGDPFRKRFNMACFIIFFNQFSGSSAISVFAWIVFPDIVGWSQREILLSFIYLNMVQVLVTFLSGQFLEKYGRRSFMLEGQRIIVISLVLLAFSEAFAPELKGVQYALIFTHMVGFSLSFGPCSFLIGTEILYDITYPSMLLWVGIFLFGLITNSLIQSIGLSNLLFIYAAVSLIGIVYIAGYLVETQGKSRKLVYHEFRGESFPLARKWNKFLTKRNTVKEEESSLSMMQNRGTQK